MVPGPEANLAFPNTDRMELPLGSVLLWSRSMIRGSQCRDWSGSGIRLPVNGPVFTSCFRDYGQGLSSCNAAFDADGRESIIIDVHHFFLSSFVDEGTAARFRDARGVRRGENLIVVEYS